VPREQPGEYVRSLTEDQPPNTTIVITMGNGETWIVLPNPGWIWVVYEWAQEPAAEMLIWHQGGSITPIEPGEGTYQVGAGDAIVYALQNPTDSIKFGWAYISAA